MKTLTKAQLENLKRTGAKVGGQPVDKIEPEPTPEPKPIQQIDPGPMNRLADAASKTVESANKVELALSNGLSSTEKTLQDLIKNLKTEKRDPVPYDLVITRRRDGLIEKIRLNPVSK